MKKKIPSKTTTTFYTLTRTILYPPYQKPVAYCWHSKQMSFKKYHHTRPHQNEKKDGRRIFDLNLYSSSILNWNQIKSVSLINWCHGRKNVFVCSSSSSTFLLLFEKWKIKNISKNKTTIWTVEHEECLKNFQGF